MAMILRVLEARPVGGYRFWLRFSDGHEGVADLGDLLQGPVFGPLRDEALFGQGRLDPEVGTLTWPNDADVAPEALLFRACRDEQDLLERFRAWGYLDRPS